MSTTVGTQLGLIWNLKSHLFTVWYVVMKYMQFGRPKMQKINQTSGFGKLNGPKGIQKQHEVQ